MNALISIILPVYNRAHTLPDCIASILAQTHQNFEVILIDDGSTDTTPQLCQSYTADPRFRLIQGEHHGVSAARNLGLEMAKGDYVFFVDSDDAIHPLLLQTLVEAMADTDAQVGATPIQNIPDRVWAAAQEKLPNQPGPGTVHTLEKTSAISTAFVNGSALRAIGGTMMRRDLIGKTRFHTDLTIGEDFYFLYENLLKGAKTILLEQRWYYCRLHEANSSKDRRLTGFNTRFLRRKLVWTSEEALGRHQNARQEKQEAFAIFLKHLEMGQMPREERKQMCRTIRAHRKALLPALTFKYRLQYHIFTRFPGLFRLSRIFKKKT